MGRAGWRLTEVGDGWWRCEQTGSGTARRAAADKCNAQAGHIGGPAVSAILLPTKPNGRGRAERALVSPMRCAEETDAARRVLESGALAQADEVAAFEQEFSDALVLDRPASPSTPAPAGCTLVCWRPGSAPVTR